MTTHDDETHAILVIIEMARETNNKRLNSLTLTASQKRAAERAVEMGLLTKHNATFPGYGMVAMFQLQVVEAVAYLYQIKARLERLFIGVYPGGIVYADRSKEVSGDYARLAFLSYHSLELEVQNDCPSDLLELIKAHASTLQSRRGELFQISTCGQTVMLGPVCSEEVCT